MRKLFLAILAVALAGCTSTSEEPIGSVVIKEVKPRYISEQNFKRISEYWTGAENKGGRVILRSDPETRSGFYFTLILDVEVRDLPRGSVITGKFHTPYSKEPQIHDFNLPNKLPKTEEIFVGLTGADWPDPDAIPAAWHFTIKDASGKALAEKKSYLWSM